MGMSWTGQQAQAKGSRPQRRAANHREGVCDGLGGGSIALADRGVNAAAHHALEGGRLLRMNHLRMAYARFPSCSVFLFDAPHTQCYTRHWRTVNPLLEPNPFGTVPVAFFQPHAMPGASRGFPSPASVPPPAGDPSRVVSLPSLLPCRIIAAASTHPDGPQRSELTQ